MAITKKTNKTNKKVTAKKAPKSVTSKLPKVLKVKTTKAKKPTKKKVEVIVNTVLDENPFLNDGGVKKQEAREMMVKYIIGSGILDGEILTLPNVKCIIEKMLLKKSKKFEFQACELNEEVYNKMLLTIAEGKLPISVNRGGIAKKINEARENQYSHLILDYCGQLATFHKEIKHAIQKNIVRVGGTIHITLNKRISRGTEAFYERMETLNPPKESNPKLREDNRSEQCLNTFINRIGGDGYALKDTLPYKDKSSMVLMVIQRIA